MVTPFTYKTGTSVLHRLDVRCKSALVCLISLAMIYTGPTGGLVWLLVMALALVHIGQSPWTTFVYLKWFLVFLLMIWLVRALSEPGTPVPNLLHLPLTWEGIAAGGLSALRFFILMVTGLIFSATTKPAQVKAAAQWFLAPIPLIPEKRVAVMISLALGFLPLILKQLEETRNALKARCADRQRNPVTRTVNLCFPLLRKTFAAADHMILAMESRCYSEDRTDPEFTGSGRETVFMVLVPALALVLAWLP